MKDLVICYSNENGDIKKVSYDTIMDFIDEMESNNPDIPMLDYTNVNAVFFENPKNSKPFDTIEMLLGHCKLIVK